MTDEKRTEPETEPCPTCGRPARVLGREPKILACVQHTTVAEAEPEPPAESKARKVANLIHRALVLREPDAIAELAAKSKK